MHFVVVLIIVMVIVAAEKERFALAGAALFFLMSLTFFGIYAGDAPTVYILDGECHKIRYSFPPYSFVMEDGATLELERGKTYIINHSRESLICENLFFSLDKDLVGISIPKVLKRRQIIDSPVITFNSREVIVMSEPPESIEQSMFHQRNRRLIFVTRIGDSTMVNTEANLVRLLKAMQDDYSYNHSNL